MGNLKDLLGEELHNQVKEKLGKDREIILNDGSYVPRERLNEKLEEIKFINSQYEQTLQKLQQLQNETANVDEIKFSLEEIQSKYEQEKSAWQEQLQNIKIENEIDKALIKVKARNPKAVKALLDKEKIKLEEDKVIGVEEQLEELRKNEPYLFDSGEKVPNTSQKNITHSSDNPYAKSNFNLTKQLMLESENPELAAKLKKEAIGQ